MLRKGFLIFLVVSGLCWNVTAFGAEDFALEFAGQDLYFSGESVVSHQLSTSEHCLLFENGFKMTIGSVNYSSDEAAVWLTNKVVSYQGRRQVEYDVRVYLRGSVSSNNGKKGRTIQLREKIIAPSQEMALYFSASGEVFVTADKTSSSDVQGNALYKHADGQCKPVEPVFVIQKEAQIPDFEIVKKDIEPLKEARAKQQEISGVGAIDIFGAKKDDDKKQVTSTEKVEKSIIKEAIDEESVAKVDEKKEVQFTYPVYIGPVGDEKPRFESAPIDDEGDVEAVTLIGRFYLWQRIEGDMVLELQADRAVIYYSRGQLDVNPEQVGADDILAKGAVSAIYVAGDVVLSEGSRTIRADEVYYDFKTHKAVALNAVLRSFDESRNIPIYVRGSVLRRLSKNKFAAEDVTITTSEFYQPQISATAAEMVLTDTTSVDAAQGNLNNRSYEAELQDVRLKAGENTIFAWPYMKSNLEEPDTAIKRINIGYDSDWGGMLETQWYLARLLGLEEPQGVSSTLNLDYYTQRGPGVGGEIEYTRENYFGSILGYVIRDGGKDDLGRHWTRNGIDHNKDFRGRFSVRHRHFLPHNWQFTGEINYASDKEFIESFYRDEFLVNKQETYAHMKNVEDNRAISILAKTRIDKFSTQLEEMPTIELHQIGESIMGSKLTVYNDFQISAMQQSLGGDRTWNAAVPVPFDTRNFILTDRDPFTLMSFRSEIDMPFKTTWGSAVPYVAGTFLYDDRSGFSRSQVDGTNTGVTGDRQAWIGEAGIRLFSKPYWKIYPNVKSRLWDVDRIRHIVQPSITAGLFHESNSFVDQADFVSFGISQRLQTKRGPAGRKRTVDWMRLNTQFVFVENQERAADSDTAPDRLTWGRPFAPARVMSAPDIYNADMINNLHRFEDYGPKRSYIAADYSWKISDSTTLISDIYANMNNLSVQQFDIGFSRMVWPNLTYYIGSRYLKNVNVLGEKGTNTFTFAATYILDPRYSLVFSQQYDFDYGDNIRSNITLIRKYHRLCYGLTFSTDESIDKQGIMFSIWPQGVQELALGERRYVDIDQPRE